MALLSELDRDEAVISPVQICDNERQTTLKYQLSTESHVQISRTIYQPRLLSRLQAVINQSILLLVPPGQGNRHRTCAKIGWIRGGMQSR